MELYRCPTPPHVWRNNFFFYRNRKYFLCRFKEEDATRSSFSAGWVCPCNFLTHFQLHRPAQEQEVLNPCQQLFSSRGEVVGGGFGGEVALRMLLSGLKESNSIVLCSWNRHSWNSRRKAEQYIKHSANLARYYKYKWRMWTRNKSAAGNANFCGVITIINST